MASAFQEQGRLLIGKSKPIIFDVGAYIGVTTRAYLKLFPTARIFAFEPGDTSYLALCSIAASSPSVTPFNVAVSDRNGFSTYYHNAFSPTSSLSPVDNTASSHWDSTLLATTSMREVPTVSIDTFCKEHGLTAIDILKLDIQGGEYKALLGAEEMLRSRAVDLIFMELLLVPTYRDQASAGDIICYLESIGYSLHSLFNPLMNNQRVNQVDAIFLPHSVVGQS